MASEKERIDRVDRENELLGDPIRPPVKYDDNTKDWVPVIELFLRAPRGIRAQSGDRSGLPDGWLRYSRPDKDPNPFLDLYVGVVTDPNKDLLGEAMTLTGGASPVTDRRKVTRGTGGDEEGAPEFDTITLSDERSTWYVYGLKRGKVQIGIVYRAERGKQAAKVTDTVNASLDTLALEGAAEAATQRYWRYHQQPAPAAPATNQSATQRS
jgi:hypothetical protein